MACSCRLAAARDIGASGRRGLPVSALTPSGGLGPSSGSEPTLETGSWPACIPSGCPVLEGSGGSAQERGPLRSVTAMQARRKRIRALCHDRRISAPSLRFCAGCRRHEDLFENGYVIEGNLITVNSNRCAEHCTTKEPFLGSGLRAILVLRRAGTTRRNNSHQRSRSLGPTMTAGGRLDNKQTDAARRSSGRAERVVRDIRDGGSGTSSVIGGPASGKANYLVSKAQFRSAPA